MLPSRGRCLEPMFLYMKGNTSLWYSTTYIGIHLCLRNFGAVVGPAGERKRPVVTQALLSKGKEVYTSAYDAAQYSNYTKNIIKTLPKFVDQLFPKYFFSM